MMLFMGLAEIVIGVPIIVAAVLANCTPTSIAMASWIIFHGLLGCLISSGFCLPHANKEPKVLVRKVYFGLLVIGIGLGIAAAIHGGVGDRLGYSFNAPNSPNSTNAASVKNVAHPYKFDLFFGIFGGIFEVLCLITGVWSFFADKKKFKKMQTLSSTPRSSFASLALAHHQAMESGLAKNRSKSDLKKSENSFHAPKGDSDKADREASRPASIGMPDSGKGIQDKK